MFYCNACKLWLSEDKFYPSYLKLNRHQCKNCHREYNRKYTKKHNNKINKEETTKKYKRNWLRTKLRDMRKEILERLGNKCTRCGVDDFRCLEIDHVFNNGAKERKIRKGSSYEYYTHLLGLPQIELEKHYQILCSNCNSIKRYEVLHQEP